ncbi:MAG: Rpn family recombination-promoting nuclease/putative transposase [Richelia sp. RM2_1_2]|nr:Rpn family recombination-promoting nuclease/putative transposase [Richelia sp. SM1_7_0]NJN10715.1 Rpn family recombination-promoting nuclease/putative transposase [Richelia sp. RM1_1_1]NJO31658.1 Rpn family recombination-promoting nuclease/putative transposase [Richelia sp. SL_2_1]NJO57963.1 Rpn family recombination-promoting nuclease/putative transposase [Richelia sp. RM2_1_2]
MKTDTIFYTLLQNLPSVLFELLEQSPTQALHYEFSSVEIKELARRIDGLFIPKPEYPQDPIYFIEVQYQRDDDLYWRLITEAFVYLNQYRPEKAWKAVVLWAKRSLDPGIPIAYQTSLSNGQIQVIYLDQLTDTSSIGLKIIGLVVAPENEAVEVAKNLIAQVQLADVSNRRQLLELVERMLIYKFSNQSRQELEAMFGLTEWRQTKFYQEVEQETKLKTVPRLLNMGLSVEQIAQALELDIEVVRKAIEKQG